MEATTSTTGSCAGKYLTFSLAEQSYAIEIHKVQEIITLVQLTSVPKTEPHQKGVINLRGQVIPVIDLRVALSLPEVTHNEKSCIIVIRTESGGSSTAGVIVDAVTEVRQFQSQHIEPVPGYLVNADTPFILGMGRTEDNQIVILLDIEHALLGARQVSKGETN